MACYRGYPAGAGGKPSASGLRFDRDSLGVSTVADALLELLGLVAEWADAGVPLVEVQPPTKYPADSATSPRFVPLVPRLPELLFQAVHSHDAGQAFRLATVNRDVSGAFNLAADPALGSHELADLLGARTVPLPAWILRQLAALAWHARLVPTEPGMVDLLLALPLMDTSRARDELGWQPTHSAADALLELLAGMRQNAGSGTPPLEPSPGMPGRLLELRTGIGATDK